MITQHDQRPGEGVFFIVMDGYRRAELRYKTTEGVLDVLHTEVSPKLSGHNVGFGLIETVVNFARENSFKVKLSCSCSFARSVFYRTPSFKDVLV